MILLALDLGTSTGFCCGDDKHSVSGTWSLKQGRFDGGGMRFVKFRGRLNELYNAYKFERVVYEEVRRHLGTDAAHVYGGLQALLTEWCETRSIPYEGVSVGVIKKFATGKGNASKFAMLAYARGIGVETDDDNEADAVALFQCVMARGDDMLASNRTDFPGAKELLG